MSLEKLESHAAEVAASVKALQDYAKREGGAIVGAAFKELLAKRDDVQEVSWTQYTPYFNDGDECVFGVNELVVDGDYQSEYRPDPKNKDLVELFSRLKSSTDTMKAVFGDHCKVTITRDEVRVETYDHE